MDKQRNKQIHEQSMRFLEDNPRYKYILNGFYDWMGSKTEETKYKYITISNTFLEYCNKKSSELYAFDYDLFLSRYRSYSVSYQQHIYAALSNLSSYLLAVKIADKDYLLELKNHKQRQIEISNDSEAVRGLTDEQMQLLLNNVRSRYQNSELSYIEKAMIQRDELIILFFLFTGIRRRQILRMNVEDIGYENGHMIARAIRRSTGIIECEYIVTEEAEALLQSYIEFREAFVQDSSTSELFITEQKKRLSAAGLDYIVKQYGEGIGKISVTELRETYLRRLYKCKRHIIYEKERTR